jgi:hypothetical protein
MAIPVHAPVVLLVEELLCGALYWLSDDGLRVVGTLVACNGRPGPMQRLIASLGLRNRHQLTRLLARENLPPLECLAAWIRVLLWVTAWERHSTTLAAASLIDGEDPAIRFRTIRRVANCTWNELKTRGSSWAVLELQSRCLMQEEARWALTRSA